MLHLSASPYFTLLRVQHVRGTIRPPLSLDRHLRRERKLPSFHLIRQPPLGLGHFADRPGSTSGGRSWLFLWSYFLLEPHPRPIGFCRVDLCFLSVLLPHLPVGSQRDHQRVLQKYLGCIGWQPFRKVTLGSFRTLVAKNLIKVMAGKKWQIADPEE